MKHFFLFSKLLSLFCFFACMHHLHAEVVYTDILDQTINTTGSSLDFDINGDGTDDVTVSLSASTSSIQGISPTLVTDVFTTRARSYPSGVIDGGQSFSASDLILCAGGIEDWCNSNERFTGLELTIAGQTHYGFIGMTGSGGGTPTSITINSFAYEDCPNTGISSGATSGGISCAVAPAGVPTLSEWGLIILALMFMTMGTLYLVQPNFRRGFEQK